MSRLLRLVLAVIGCLLAGPAAAQGVGQWVSPGPLAQDHADLEGITNCTKCHAPMMGVTTDRCVACHEDVGREIATQKGFHANKANKCGSCHADHKGRDYQLARLNLSPLEHLKETGFALEGAHIKAKCTDCHTPGKWGDLSKVCDSCHAKDDPHGTGDHTDLSKCDACHGVSGWKVSSLPTSVFSHLDPKQVDYVLKGAHVDVGCLECHVKGAFVPTAFASCTSCHQDPHRSSKISNACDSCHDVSQWAVAKFDHGLTNWPLQGRHASVDCARCHKASATKPLPHDTCESCHKDPHRKQFAPRGCDACHAQTVAAFKIPAFDHAKTKYPLLGKHTAVTCKECHGVGVAAIYTPVRSDDCDACHDDVHKGKFEPTQCAACHTEVGWDVGQFNHDRTAYPLRGKHVDVTCDKCHPNEQWSGIAHDTCDQCHTVQPHGTEFTSGSCAECHAVTDWADLTFDHASRTKFDLEPQHDGVTCKDCHEQMDHFAGTDMACASCHADDDPPGHFEGACDGCHRASAWLPADLGDQPHDVTGYPLVGTHARLACDDCHGTEWTPLAASGTDCSDCHADDDAHLHLLGDSCEDCHTPISWFRTTFQHSSTGYALRGAHRLASCDDCHAVTYVGTPTDCWRCHLSEAPTSIPAHQSAFFRQCDQCHRPYTWGALPNPVTAASRRR